MPNRSIVQASEAGTQATPATEVSSSAKPGDAKLFSGPDPSVHMLGLPKSHPRLGRWVAVAVIAGAIVAVSLIAMFVR